jgi:hypothetical protein
MARVGAWDLACIAQSEDRCSRDDESDHRVMPLRRLPALRQVLTGGLRWAGADTYVASVRSLTITQRPTIAPSAPWIATTVTKTRIAIPSLRTQVVS